MLDFRQNKKEQPDYILRAEPNQITIAQTPEQEDVQVVDTLDVYFGDGRVFRNLVFNKENLEKINKKQEEQVTEAIENLPEFEKRHKKAKLTTLAGTIVGPIAGTALAVATVPGTSAETEALKFFLTLGVVTLGCMAPGGYKLIKSYPLITQLRKFKFRNEHQEDLDNFDQYENALEGLEPEKADLFVSTKENGGNPFSAMNVDSYTQDDLETIVDNIEREKAFQFVYAKRPSKPQISEEK